MDDVSKKALAVVVKYAKPMAIELVAEIAEPAIMDMVLKSENKIDDALVPVLLPLLKQALIDQLEKIQVG